MKYGDITKNVITTLKGLNVRLLRADSIIFNPFRVAKTRSFFPELYSGLFIFNHFVVRKIAKSTTLPFRGRGRRSDTTIHHSRTGAIFALETASKSGKNALKSSEKASNSSKKYLPSPVASKLPARRRLKRSSTHSSPSRRV